MMRQFLIRFAAVFATSFLPFVAAAQEPILIGAPITITPPGPVIFGTQIREGMDLALQMVNQNNPVLGRQIKVLYEDHQGNPERARSASEKLITRDKVVAIAGMDTTGAVLASIEVARQYNVPLINGNGWADTIREKGYPQVFNPNVYTSLATDAVVDFFQAMNIKRVVNVVNNDEVGTVTERNVRRRIAEKNLDIQVTFVHVDRNSKDFLPVIAPMKSNPPEIVMITSQQPAAYILINQLYEQGVAPTRRTIVLDASSLSDAPDFWSSVGEAGKYLVTFGIYHPKMSLTAVGNRFATLHEQTHGRPPSRVTLQGADSIFVLAEGIRLAGSTDSDKLQAGLRAVKVEGTRGTIAFSSKTGTSFQQWIETPYAFYQFTEVNQPVASAPVVGGIGIKVDPANFARPK